MDPAAKPEVPDRQPPAADPATSATPAPAAAAAAPPKPVICKKGKCAPYDPTKDKVAKRNFHFF
jgi:hypothetical protein